MPRKPLLYSDCHPYHIMNRSNNKEWFYLPLNDVWEIFCSHCQLLVELYQVKIHALVLMSNHYHLLVTTPKMNIGEAMKYFHREIAKEINRKANRINHIFGTRYKWSVIDNPYYYAIVYKYMYRNPVEAKITNRIEEYRFSTIFKNNEQRISFIDDEAINLYTQNMPNNYSELLNWLNTPYKPESLIAIRKAIRRQIFKIPRQYDGMKQIINL